MEKKYLLLAVPLFSLMLMVSVMALQGGSSSFRGEGGSISKIGSVTLNQSKPINTHINFWASEWLNRSNLNQVLSYQGAGSIEIAGKSTDNKYVTLNINSKAYSVTCTVVNGQLHVLINAQGTGTYWVQGTTPTRVDYTLVYDINYCTGETTVRGNTAGGQNFVLNKVPTWMVF